MLSGNPLTFPITILSMKRDRSRCLCTMKKSIKRIPGICFQMMNQFKISLRAGPRAITKCLKQSYSKIPPLITRFLQPLTTLHIQTILDSLVTLAKIYPNLLINLSNKINFLKMTVMRKSTKKLKL